jgi:phosphate transport system substrate-binding protein
MDDRMAVVRAARLALVACALVVGPSPGTAAEMVRINGSGSCLDFMRPLLEAYLASHPGASIETRPPLGSTGSMQALLAGALDLAVIARTVRPEEEAQGARGVRYGASPLLIVTHMSVRIEDVSTAELEEIYSGRRTRWPGGEAIRVVLRPAKETNTSILLRLSPGMAGADALARLKPWAIVAVTDPESNQVVATTPGAIGLCTLTSLLGEKEPPLRSVLLDGVEGTTGALASGRYPLSKEVVFVTTARTPPAALAIIEFARSAEGRAVAERAGLLVAPKGDGS